MSSRFEVALDFLQRTVAPKASEIDRDSNALASVLDEMGDLGLMALAASEPFEGLGIEPGEFRQFQEQSARASGTFAFLQTQHQSAVRLLTKGENEALNAEYIPLMAKGKKRLGIGFSQLRRPGEPLLKADFQTGGELILNGHVPWATGFDFYHEILVGAALPSGESVFAVVPFKSESGLQVSAPMQLAAMQAANTVTIEFNNFLVPAEKIAFKKPGGWILKSDDLNVALQGQFAVGCALAGLDSMKEAAQKKKVPSLETTIRQLEAELTECRAELTIALEKNLELSSDNRLRLRGWIIDLAFRCAQGAIIANSGGANYAHSKAQRVYREALVFAVSAQTVPIMEASLLRLVRPK